MGVVLEIRENKHNKCFITGKRGANAIAKFSVIRRRGGGRGQKSYNRGSLLQNFLHRLRTTHTRNN